MKIAWPNTRSASIASHIAVWLVVFSVPAFARLFVDQVSPPFNELRPPDLDLDNLHLLPFITGICCVGIFYFNSYFLIPTVFYKRKFALYVLIHIGLLMLLALVQHSLFQMLTGLPDQKFSARSVVFSVPIFLLTVGASITIRIIADNDTAKKLLAAKQGENLKTELSFLRSQISPHFVFNVLNNMVALVRMKSDQLEPTIMKLSSLMQYMLYETAEEKVLLKTEAEYLQSYIDLQQQRFGSRVCLTNSINIGDEPYTIEPMLMIPFVENAFKHGLGMIEHPEITIDLSVTKNTLHFSVTNKYNDAIAETKDGTSGIGLANVTRRLKLLYGDQHQLNITKANHTFSVYLTIILHS